MNVTPTCQMQLEAQWLRETAVNNLKRDITAAEKCDLESTAQTQRWNKHFHTHTRSRSTQLTQALSHTHTLVNLLKRL